jgi:hypothetical protein
VKQRKHRTEDTEATEGGFWVGGRKNLVNLVGFGARTRVGGKHRTEVAEVREGDWRTRELEGDTFGFRLFISLELIFGTWRTTIARFTEKCPAPQGECSEYKESNDSACPGQ